MPRIGRTDIGEYVYHVLNRANARVQIFDDAEDYQLFEDILEEAVKKFDMRLLSYCIMPNHWHLVVHPKNDGDLARFMGWLTNTHTRRWHACKNTVGQGHLYQGRYKSFLCQNDIHFLTLVRYVERNAGKVNLVGNAEEWRWSSGWRNASGTAEQRKIISSWPVPVPENYFAWLNQPQTTSEEDAIRNSIIKSKPFGDDNWVNATINRFNLEQTLRRVGRPKVK